MPIYINQKDDKVSSHLSPVMDNLMEENSIAVNEESVDLEGSESMSRQNRFKLALDCKSYRYNEENEEGSKRSSQMYVSNDARARRIKEIV